MIFSERRGGAAVADTITIYYERGQKQKRRAIHVGSIFFLIHSTFFLPPASMIFSERRGGGSGGGGVDRSIYDEGGWQQRWRAI